MPLAAPVMKIDFRTVILQLPFRDIMYAKRL
jgi:hypothetical protein